MPYLIAIVALLIGLTGTHWKAYTMGEAAVTADWNAEKLRTASANAAANADARKREQAAQALIDKTRRDRDAKLKVATAAYLVLAGELQQRPARPADSAGDVPSTAGPVAAGCTGSSLYRQDAVAFARLAADADRLRANYSACKAGVDSLRGALNKP